MKVEEIKQALSDRGMTQQDLATALGINPKALNEILRGARPMTDVLRNHIRLLLHQPREAMLVYRVNITEAKAMELLGERGCVLASDRAAAIEMVIHHNLAELIELGKTCTWTDEEKKYLGIDAPTVPSYGKTLDPYA